MPPSRREDLVDAAMRVFSRSGFHGTGIEKVLQEGGISRMTLYNHFKSKDELIVAALRRRDEIFRNRMMKFVDRSASEPVGRILAVFDFFGEWFKRDDFHGCMFINALAEYADPNDPVRRVAAEHKCVVVRFLREQCAAMGAPDPQGLAEQLNLLLEGSIVWAEVACMVGGEGSGPGGSARRGRDAAEVLIGAARGDSPEVAA